MKKWINGSILGGVMVILSLNLLGCASNPPKTEGEMTRSTMLETIAAVGSSGNSLSSEISTANEGVIEYKKITPAEAKAYMDENGSNILVLDVRTETEYLEGHIEGAIRLEKSEFSDQALIFLPDVSQVILVYCRSGARSEEAAKALIEMGYQKVYDFGGIKDWPYDIVTKN